jgi:hypothetical protein
MALRMAATSLLNSKTYLGSRYRHLRKQLPSYASAIKAMARYLAVLVYPYLPTVKPGWIAGPPSLSKSAASGNWRV